MLAKEALRPGSLFSFLLRVCKVRLALPPTALHPPPAPPPTSAASRFQDTHVFNEGAAEMSRKVHIIGFKT